MANDGVNYLCRIDLDWILEMLELGLNSNLRTQVINKHSVY